MYSLTTSACYPHAIVAQFRSFGATVMYNHVFTALVKLEGLGKREFGNFVRVWGERGQGRGSDS